MFGELDVSALVAAPWKSILPFAVRRGTCALRIDEESSSGALRLMAAAA
jgi:hypothetical protein